MKSVEGVEGRGCRAGELGWKVADLRRALDGQLNVMEIGRLAEIRQKADEAVEYTVFSAAQASPGKGGPRRSPPRRRAPRIGCCGLEWVLSIPG